ncbi:MAG: efflux RND transporter periplasmic adaptor subunit [Chromatiales bacterium]|nr:efflux RND transporter periplasmic adaptor subunit [Chromatiales bacterium]
MIRVSRLMSRSMAVLGLGVLLSACSGEPETAGAPSGPRALPVTVVAVQSEDVAVTARTLGTVVSKHSPTLSAEVGARVLRIHVDEGDELAAGQLLLELDDGDFRLERQRAQAEIQRLDALIENQQRRLDRNRSLLSQKVVSQSDVDLADAELRALQGQLQATRTQLAQAERNINRTRVTAPIAGRLERRWVNEGDWAGQGEPLLHLSSDVVLRAQLPYPEQMADLLRAGLNVQLHSPAAPDLQVQTRITELRPAVGSSRSLLAMAEFDNPGGWRPGASVDAEVELYRYAEALLVPDVSVVQRPAGKVVFVLEDGKASQRLVETGRRFGDRIQIRDGLNVGEPVIVDGAGFLADGAPVRVE